MSITIDPVRLDRIDPYTGCGATRDLWVVQALQRACEGSVEDAADALTDSLPHLEAEEAEELVLCCRAAETATEWDDIPRTALASYESCQDPREAPGVLAETLVQRCLERWLSAD